MKKIFDCRMLLVRKTILIACVIAITASAAIGQNEFLSAIDYNSLAITRIGNISGVTWVTDHSTYDANHRRFYFMGNPTNSDPWFLYTINAATGATISNPVSPSNGVPGMIMGMQYDNSADKLYAIYVERLTGKAYFSWIDPVTGFANSIKLIGAFSGFNESAFDTKNHFYIFKGEGKLYVINTTTGDLVYNPSLPAGVDISYIQFNNTTSVLYAVGSSSAWTNPKLVTISLITGIPQPIGDLPTLGIPYIFTSAIDEAAKKYIFVGIDPVCYRNYLYVVDITTGEVLSRKFYPYAESASVATYENVIYFSFDNQRGTLYALNWHPPGNPTGPQLNPSLTIASSPDNICIGEPVNFIATPTNGGSSISFQWQVNGSNTGADQNTFISPSLQNGDTVRCIVTMNSNCAVPEQVISNNIVMKVRPAPCSISGPLQLPNAFSPNGDRYNEVFRVPLSFANTIIRFTVYNRWGQIVFTTTGAATGWDGTFNGKPQPPGLYVWKIEYLNNNNKTTATKGIIQLIR